MEIKIVAQTSSKTDAELLAISFEDARKLDVGEMERWTKLQNKGANLYHVNSAGELKEVPAAGWWY